MASQKNADQFKDKMNAQAEPRISQQKKAFVGWVNAHLQQQSMNISNLKDISQVSPLIHLLEILEKNSLDKITKHHKKPRNNFDKKEGMIICVQHIKSLEGSNANRFDVEILLSGKEIKIYLALIWRIIIIYSIQKVNNIQPKKSNKKVIKSPEQCLKEWVNIQLLPNKLQINNFTNEWIDGKIFICLMNKIKALDKHNQIKYENVQHMSNKQLLDHILEINEKYLNIPQLLDSNNLINSPNKESIMTYVLLLKAAIENNNINNNNNEPDLYIQEGESNEQKDIEYDIGITPGGGPLINNYNEELSDEEYNSNNNVDLAILCDITDSMNEWIDEIKSGIRRIVNELKNTFGIGKLRLSFIGYRDWNDNNNNKGQKRIEKLEFTSIETFESFIKNIKCIGGGDAAEDVLGGIKETLSISWKAPIRVLYHICDAAPHGTIYHNYFERLEKQNKYINDEMSFLDGISDSDTDSNSEEKNDNDNDNEDRDFWDKWPDKHPQDPSHEDLFTELKKNNIQYYIGTQTSFTDKMVKVFKDFCTSIDYRLTPMNLVNVSQFLPTLIEAVSDAIRICIPPITNDRQSIQINLEKIKKKKINFQVHCGIDFGTSGTGFAYALSGQNGKVYTDQNWNNSGQHVDVKTKTNILLDSKGNCIAFGDDASDKYIHTDTYENDLFFERFKMALYEKQIIANEEKENNYSKTDICQYLTATNGKQLASRKVLQEALGFMKDHAMNNLCKNINKNLEISDIQWIITVPAIWSDTAKSIMNNAAIACGMINASIDQHLIIAYEPDCASLSILHEINEKAHEQYKQQQIQKREQLTAAQNTIEENENDNEDEFKSFFECGDKILLCDLGGGTADIACHELDSNERICQIVAPSGGAWGSTYVDEYFIALLNDIFSEKWMNEFKIEEASSFIQLLSNFRDAKKTYKMNDKKKIKSKQFDITFHNIQIPFEFTSFMEEQLISNDNDNELENIVNRFIIFNKNGLIKLDGEYLELSYTIWNYLFDKVINCIINHCKKLLDLAEMKSCKFLCLVGGFSQSKYLQTKMFLNFGKKSKYDMQIYTPKRPHLSVVDGAARMGLFPNFISARSIAKTYGIAIQKDLFEFKSIYPHSLIPKVKISKRLVYAKHNKELMISKQVVNDVFLPFVRKNQLIKNNDKPIVYWVEPADVKANKISIRLFSSNQIDPIFVDDNKQADKIEIELSDTYKLHNQPIPVIFIFNDTIIRVFVQMIDNHANYKTKEISINFDAI